MSRLLSAPLKLQENTVEGDDGLLSARQLDDAFAAEFVLGVLDPGEAAEAEARSRQDPGFAALIDAWRQRMTDDPLLHAAASPARPTETPRAVPRQQVSKSRFAEEAMRFLAGSAVAIALVLATMAIFAMPQLGVVATLAAADNRLSYKIVEYGDEMQVSRLTGAAAPKGSVHQLWLITHGEGAIPLGLLEGQSLIIDRPVPPKGSRFAVSVEPEGGSALNKPSGPLILMAEVAR